MLAAGSGSTLEEARAVLARMAVCRKKMGEGTLFSTLFEPATGKAHLYFYHDFNEVVTFDIVEELAKGDRTVEMASLFGARPEFTRLQNYITPFHQRWLFWSLFGLMILAGFGGLWSAVALVRALFGRAERPGVAFAQAVLPGMGCTVVIGLIGVLLMQEGPYYFGLSDVSPLLAWLPMALTVLVIILLALRRLQQAPLMMPALLGTVIFLPLMLLLGYWGLWWP